MSEEGNKKLYAHYTSLIGGSVKSSNPSNPVRDELVVSDAKRHLADLVRKNPDTVFEKPPKAEVPEEPKAKSKRKR